MPQSSSVPLDASHGSPSSSGAVSTMDAFGMKSIGSLGFLEKPRPSPGPRDAVLRTTRALVCECDLHTVNGAIGSRENMTLGHEAVGVVEEVGEEVRLVQPGDRVAVGTMTPDWSSPAAQDGHPSQSHRTLGGWRFANRKDGVFAEYVHVNDADGNLAPIPDSVSDEAAVYVCDVMSNGFMAASRADIPLGGTVAIFSQGPIGLMAAAAADRHCAGRVFVVEASSKRAALAERYGADRVVDPKARDPVETLMEWTDGEGVDSAIDARGSTQSIARCIEVTRDGGTISNVVGYHGEAASPGGLRDNLGSGMAKKFLNGAGPYRDEEEQLKKLMRLMETGQWMTMGLGMAEKTINTGLGPGGRLHLTRLLRLLESGRVDPTPMTTHKFPFNRTDQAFAFLASGDGDVIKAMLVFD